MTQLHANDLRFLRGVGDGEGTQGQDARLAPWPTVDRFPTVQGTNLNLQYVAMVFRSCTTGYRRLYVDMLDELLEMEPHCYTLLFQRNAAVACARMEITPPPGLEKDAEAMKAADLVRDQLENLNDRVQSFSDLLWATYYAVGCTENMWDTDGKEFRVTSCEWIHPRRIGYPSLASWDPHIWDEGSVRGYGIEPSREAQTSAIQRLFGIRIPDYPDKFTVYAPRLRNDYPTREGIGRELAVYMLLKRMVIRTSAQDFERFIKPWIIAYYNTSALPGVESRAALPEDIDEAKRASLQGGLGALFAAVLPNSIKLDALKIEAILNPIDFANYLEDSMTKAVLGQTYTVQPGKFGSKGTAQVGKNQELERYRFDATLFGECIRRNLAKPMCRHNSIDERKAPRIVLHPEDDPDGLSLMQAADLGTGMGVPIDKHRLAKSAGLPVTNKTDDMTQHPKPEPPAGGIGAAGKKKKPSKPKKAE